MRIIIAGGGIGGLTLALMLHQRGLDCQVNKAAVEVKPLGVGINALLHSIRELAALGLLPRLDEIAIRPRQLQAPVPSTKQMIRMPAQQATPSPVGLSCRCRTLFSGTSTQA
jgi:2-polyprenyl-6-methoxyphenol hydroxylase-like FAD-dependent oxidoreductase